MLELQRASAGSGKTFALAGKYIWYYITIADEGGRRRLRSPEELSDSLSHILAVTFTNKATNEMQQRIVEKLYALAYPPISGKKPDYMEDFIKRLSRQGRKVTEEELSMTCRRAVALLLNNYSDFHVSTIDSFFQQVLRTFAYESDLSDSYRIELDTDFLSLAAIDALLEDINSGRDTTGADFWISELMNRAKEEGKKWNIFAKSLREGSLYLLLTQSVKRLENEEFKVVRRHLDSYFNSGVDFPALYSGLKEKYETRASEAHRKMNMAVKEFSAVLKDYAHRIDSKDSSAFRTRINKLSALKTFEIAVDSKKNEIADFTPKDNASYEKRKKKGDTEAYDALEAADREMTESYNLRTRLLMSDGFRHWKLYRENLPFMGLLQAIREKREEYLRENNAIELGETNAMLHDIIGEDDAPFIYERIGTRLNHFLIDEFQDTSKMQWQNITPLLHESLGRGNENLIIGDAKQSIYRFRNADSSLISRKVEEEFGAMVKTPEGDETKNTNWRSDLRIVEFNNGFFDFMTTELNRLVGVEASENRRDFRADYLNVVQHPHHKEKRGYVEVHIGESSDKEWDEKTLMELPSLVEDILKRGFRMRDIAVLVDTNGEGEDVIARFTEYNASLPEGAVRLEYVSEQSLRLVSSAAVALVTSVLETISRGADPEVRTGDERSRRGVADWSQVACNFRFFALRHPELSTPECLETFFNGGGDNNAIGEMLHKMQAVTLPALVESIIAEFLPEEVRRTDAVFLAAFQDLVLEYCEGRPSDIASFLKWWDDKKKSASIASPEDMDAIAVMTVHKSKGLEFPVVIVPFADAMFGDSTRKTEWRWVRPEQLSTEGPDLPPFIPVPTDASVKATRHEHILYEYHDLRKMDMLNSIYVAFTRAASELYIFSKPASKKDEAVSLAGLLESYMGQNIEEASPENEVYLPDTSTSKIFTYGSPYMECMPEKKERGSVKEIVIEDYTARPTPDFLLYRMEDLPEVVDADDAELNDDPDPRSEGNMLHEVMQSVKRQEDIPKSVRRLVIKGLATREEAARMAAFLTVKTSRKEVSGWFKDGWRVINERPLLRSGSGMKRPDRVMVSSEGEAVVVDYKFGESLSSSKKYARQVYDYVETLKDTGKFRSVTGYLWYVRLDRLELVAR